MLRISLHFLFIALFLANVSSIHFPPDLHVSYKLENLPNRREHKTREQRSMYIFLLIYFHNFRDGGFYAEQMWKIIN